MELYALLSVLHALANDAMSGAGSLHTLRPLDPGGVTDNLRRVGFAVIGGYGD